MVSACKAAFTCCIPQGRVNVPEGKDPKAALPPDVRKGCAFPKACALTNLSARLEGSAFQPSGRGKGGGFHRKARGFPHIRRQSRFIPDFEATLRHTESALASLY